MMRIVGGDVSRASNTALGLAHDMAVEVAELAAFPRLIRGPLAADLDVLLAAVHAHLQDLLQLAASLGAAPAQIAAVEETLVRVMAVQIPRIDAGRSALHLAELIGTLAAEAVIHAVPSEALGAMDEVAAHVPDGPGWATPGPTTPTAASPSTAAGWLGTIDDAQMRTGQIEVTHLDNGRWVVSLPGIHSFTEAADPLDLPGAAHAFGTRHGAYAGAVVMALTLAGVPKGAQLMLVGHSQGGIVAADLAADPAVNKRWQITHLLTAAAPIDNTPLPPQTGVLALRNRDDIVPELDLAPDTATAPTPSGRRPRTEGVRPATRLTVAFDAERGSIGANHDLTATYLPFAESSEFTADRGVLAWEVDARDYLGGGAATTQRFQLLDRAPPQAAAASKTS